MKTTTIQEAFDITTKIEAKIPSSKEGQSFVQEVKACEPKDTPDIPKGVPSLKKSTEETPEDLEQDISQQEVERKDIDDIFESHKEEQMITHSSSKNNEDVFEEIEPKEIEPEDIKHDDELFMCPPPSNETIQNPIFPTQEEEDEVSHFSFQDLDNTLFYDSESEGEMKSLGKVDPLCCTIEDVEASIPFDKVFQILEAPTQEEVNKVSCFPSQIFNDSLSHDVESEEVLDCFTPS
jgi:hypothetical protein